MPREKTYISSKCDEVWFGDTNAKAGVQLLFIHHLPILWRNRSTAEYTINKQPTNKASRKLKFIITITQ